LIPWVLVDEAAVPGGRETLRLMRRGTEFSILLGAVELMNSRLSGSEEALATHSCARIAARSTPTLLIGGLGMGFTLRAALGCLAPSARVVVAELVPAVVAWARGPMADLFAGCLEDSRVDVVTGDVGACIRSASATYDAILLDVDNGPAGQTRDANDGLYGARGLAEARHALRPGGILSVWSVEPNAAFVARMRTAGFRSDELRVKANAGKRGARHVIWIGQRA
jgi:spermidine synthase